VNSADTPLRLPLLRRLAETALGAGVVAGLLLAVLQALWVTPLILEAETHEVAPAAAPVLDASPAEAARLPDAEPEPWAPADRVQRTALTALADVLAMVGGALLLAAGMALRGGAPSPGNGVLWGAGGYAAFVLAPALGLPPELPGMPAAALGARQLWWLGTVAATGAGLALLAFAPRWGKVVGALLVLAPHVLGAPHPPADAPTAVPAALAAHYVAAVLVTTAAAWAVLGALCAWGLGRRG
jgi:cobalt transporter subunit CbtA